MSQGLKNILFCWLPLITYCVFIFIQSSFPSTERLPSFNFSDKIMHFGAFAVMGVLFYRAYQTLPFDNILQWIVPLSMLSASLYGISDEIHQSFVPYRHASIGDVIADILGAICGVYVYHRWVTTFRSENRGQKPDDRGQRT